MCSSSSQLRERREKEKDGQRPEVVGGGVRREGVSSPFCLRDGMDGWMPASAIRPVRHAHHDIPAAVIKKLARRHLLVEDGAVDVLLHPLWGLKV